jgi:hypothetical protein
MEHYCSELQPVDAVPLNVSTSVLFTWATEYAFLSDPAAPSCFRAAVINIANLDVGLEFSHNLDMRKFSFTPNSPNIIMRTSDPTWSLLLLARIAPVPRISWTLAR